MYVSNQQLSFEIISKGWISLFPKAIRFRPSKFKHDFCIFRRSDNYSTNILNATNVLNAMKCAITRLQSFGPFAVASLPQMKLQRCPVCSNVTNETTCEAEDCPDGQVRANHRDIVQKSWARSEGYDPWLVLFMKETVILKRVHRDSSYKRPSNVWDIRPHTMADGLTDANLSTDNNCRRDKNLMT